MEYSPPPLFKQGAPARVKVTVFALISIALLMIDSRLQSLNMLRQVAGTVLYPFQVVALMPRDALASMGSYFSSLSALQKEVDQLKSSQIASAQLMQQARFEMAENVHLRRLMGAREQVPVKSVLSEILYDARDPATSKIILDRGTRQDIAVGMPVIDYSGVVGQVTRVFPFTSEVTLLTDRDQVIPVQVLRNGLRSVAYGRGQGGLLDLRFVTPNADIQVGDILITSGLDGVYPAGLAVAKVVQVESNATGNFGRVVSQPLAGIDRNRQLLILTAQSQLPARPPADAAIPAKGKKPDMPALPSIPGMLTPAAPATAAPASAAAAGTTTVAPQNASPSTVIPGTAGNDSRANAGTHAEPPKPQTAAPPTQPARPQAAVPAATQPAAPQPQGATR